MSMVMVVTFFRACLVVARASPTIFAVTMSMVMVVTFFRACLVVARARPFVFAVLVAVLMAVLVAYCVSTQKLVQMNK
jgi:hypothetical protein